MVGSAHLEQLAIDATRSLRGREAMAEIVGRLVVRRHLDGALGLALVADLFQSRVSESNQLGLARRYRPD